MYMLTGYPQNGIISNDTLSHIRTQEINALLEEIKKHEETQLGIDSVYCFLLDSLARYYRNENDSVNILHTDKKLIPASRTVYGNNDIRYIYILVDVSNDYWNQNMYDDVISIQKELYEYFRLEMGDINDLNEIVTLKIATCYSRKNEYSKAIEWMSKAINIQKGLYGEENPEYIKSLLLISGYYSNIKEYKSAIEYTERASSICKKANGENNPTYEYSISTLSRYYYYIKDYASAIKLGKEALDICTKIYDTDNYNYIICLSNLSMYYEALGDIKKAIDYQSIVVRYNKSHSNVVNYATSINNLATLYYKIDPAETCGLLEEAKSILVERFKTEEIYYTINNNLADCYFKLANYDKSAEAIIEAVEFARKDVLTRRTHLSNADRFYNWKKYYLVFNRILPFILTKSDNKKYNGAIFNNTALFSKIISQYPTSEADKLLNITKNKQHTSWENIREKLNEEDIAIEFVNYVDDKDSIRYYALVLENKSEFPVFVPLCYESDFINSSSSQRYDLIWKPILSLADNKKRIYFSPSGVLNSWPIEYLPVNDSIHIDDLFDIYRLSTTAQLLKGSTESREYQNAILFGGLTYETDSISNDYVSQRSGFDFLPNTLLEIKEISNILEENVIRSFIIEGSNGTEKRFKEISGSPMSIIHLATHGLYVSPRNANRVKTDNNFSFIITESDYSTTEEMMSLSRSALVMSNGNLLPRRENFASMDDGILTANEISNIDLQLCDLVVLSACNTGLGDITIDGSYGLQRGFKKAGANTILMSLRKVDDEATKILMVGFYRNLMSGKTKLQSLKDAQKYLRSVENGKYDKPEYWASFIMLDGLN